MRVQPRQDGLNLVIPGHILPQDSIAKTSCVTALYEHIGKLGIPLGGYTILGFDRHEFGERGEDIRYDAKIQLVDIDPIILAKRASEQGMDGVLRQIPKQFHPVKQ